jgi:hypothetical protein
LCREVLDEARTFATRRHIAAIEEDVAVRREHLSDLGQFCLIGLKAEAGQGVRAQAELALRAVREHVDGGIAGMALRPQRHLRQPALAAVDQLHLDAGADSGHQGLVIAYRGVYEGDFLAAIVPVGIQRAQLHRGGGGVGGGIRVVCAVDMGGVQRGCHDSAVEQDARLQGHDQRPPGVRWEAGLQVGGGLGAGEAFEDSHGVLP